MTIEEFLEKLEKIQSEKKETADLHNAIITYLTTMAPNDFQEFWFNEYSGDAEALFTDVCKGETDFPWVEISSWATNQKIDGEPVIFPDEVERFLEFYYSRPKGNEMRYWFDPTQEKSYVAIGDNMTAVDLRAGISALLYHMDQVDDPQRDPLMVEGWRWETVSKLYGEPTPDIEDLWLRADDLACDMEDALTGAADDVDRRLPSRMKELIRDALVPIQRAKETDYNFTLHRDGELIDSTSLNENDPDLAAQLFYEEFDHGPPQHGDQIALVEIMDNHVLPSDDDRPPKETWTTEETPGWSPGPGRDVWYLPPEDAEPRTAYKCPACRGKGEGIGGVVCDVCGGSGLVEQCGSASCTDHYDCRTRGEAVGWKPVPRRKTT